MGGGVPGVAVALKHGGGGPHRVPGAACKYSRSREQQHAYCLRGAPHIGIWSCETVPSLGAVPLRTETSGPVLCVFGPKARSLIHFAAPIQLRQQISCRLTVASV